MTLVSGNPDCVGLLDDPKDCPAPEATRRVALDRSVAELSPIVFASLPRADQRRKGLMYLRGLLGATGRKSVRNIAAFLKDEVNDQGLHHFINDSTWEWAPMREALGRHLVHRLPPRAYVVHPLLIPKSGTHSAGVTRTFSWERGQAVTAQQVTGVWGVTTNTASPLNWQLHLPPKAASRRIPGSARRATAGGTDPETPEKSMVNAYLETAARLALPRRPVVLNAERLDGIKLVSTLAAAGLRHVSKVAGDTWLLPSDPSLPGWGDDPLQARRIAQMAKAGRNRVALIPYGPSDTPELVVTVRVRLPAVRDAWERVPGNGDYLLVAVGRSRAQWPDELWLTDMPTADLSALLRLVGLSRQVAHHGVPLAERVGIRDFVGRSYAGWNRHATLASIAHAATQLAELRLDSTNMTPGGGWSPHFC
ncbi:IS701 family transposase [Streptomyces sp. CA-250714]|uniref:IS701 family transposase n=1 Tax=Streptomyces sp. CA-250714 TaxID=3240060 RepID=UPI003D8CBB7F